MTMTKVMYDKILGRTREGGDEGGGGGGNAPKIITVDAINGLTTEQCESLNAGDVVVVSSGGVDYTCIVTTKTGNVLYLAYIVGDDKLLYKARYINSESTWVFNKTVPFDLETPVINTMPQSGMVANKVYVLGELNSDTTFVMAAATDNTIVNIWTWTFSTGSTAPTITWPAQIAMWSDGEAPTIEANKRYEVSVMDGLACVVSADIPQQQSND